MKTILDTYVKDAIRTAAPITNDVLKRMNDCAELLHAGMGGCTEDGEFLDALKKHIFYGAPLDTVNLLEELGDKMWYIALAITYLDGNLEEVMTKNIAKLRARFPNKFTQEDALNRDLEKERKELE